MAVNLTSFFTKAGKAFHAGNVTLTAVGTTIEDEAEDFTQEFTTETIEIKDVTKNVYSALKGLQSAASGALAGIITTPIQQLLVAMVAADNPQENQNVNTAVDELIRQMLASADSLEKSTPACTPSYGGANVGNGVIVISVKRPDGKTNEHIFQESIEGVVTSVASDQSATISIVSEDAVAALSHLWPDGSGVSTSIPSVVASSAGNIVGNGTFATASTLDANLPLGWIAPTSQPGTTLKLTSVEIQTIAMTGTPTTGYYVVHWVDRLSDSHTTAPLAYNATSAALLAELVKFPELSGITIVQSGTTPNLTHTITMTGVSNPAQFTSTEYTDAGTLTHATTTAGSANVVRGARSLEFDGNGAELTTIMRPVTLGLANQYAIALTLNVDVTPAAGVLTVDLVDGVGGTVLNDDQGVANSFTIALTALTSTFVIRTGVFRTPSTMVAAPHLRIRASTAISGTTSCFINEVVMVAMTSLYTGGLYVSAFSGPTKWAVADTITLPVTNDRAGSMHEWCARVFGLRERNILMPTNAVSTISDGLIS